MPPITVNRRRFLGCSAAAGLALSQGAVAETLEGEPRSIRLGLIGAGTRGTTLLRTLLELPGVQIAAVADQEARHAARASGIAEKATGHRPDCLETADQLLARTDVEAVVVALPCDKHAVVYSRSIQAGKHIYAEKPLAPTLEECDLVIREAEKAPRLAVHVGYQRRSNPRYREAVTALTRGEAGELISGTVSWNSSNGPMLGHEGWLGRRDRSGDWMVEQAVHVWDVFHWILGSSPIQASGHGRRDLFAATHPGRDVTDDYSVRLSWKNGFQLNFSQSWVVPADDSFTGIDQRVIATEGGLDLSTGTLTYRDRSRPRRSIHPTNQPDTKLALESFLKAVRSPEPLAPPITLADAREATRIGLLARLAVDSRGTVGMDEIERYSPA